VRGSRHHTERPVLITEARISGDEEFDRRRKRYLLMMLIRALCIVAAALTFHLSGWLAAAFVVGALVLPWTAVLLANDRPPKEGVRFRRFLGGTRHPGPRELTSATDQPPNAQPPNAQPPNAQPPNAQQPNAQQPNAQQPNAQQPDGQRPDGQQQDGQSAGKNLARPPDPTVIDL
jgi:hypothetical protein